MEREHLDVVVVGAGLSGIGAGYYLQTQCPGRSYAILEGRAALGGTWDLFRYPGVRSDSDMFTLGYSFHPWQSRKSITDGESILNYIRLTAEKFGIDKHIRYQQRVVDARWSTEEGRWTLDIDIGAGAARTRQTLTCGFLYLCTGYYRYDAGYTPEWDTLPAFKGRVVHPQAWPDDLEYANKRVVVIGSGATAVTLVPAMAQTAAHVTMLQRSPTYIVAQPSESAASRLFQRVLPAQTAHTLSRWWSILFQMYQFALARRFPGTVKKAIMDMARQELGANYPVETHLNPRYNPWDERLCVVPDGDLFQAMKAGRADIVTDQIERFTDEGLVLASGQVLAADVIVTATGLRLKLLDGVTVVVDGETVDMGRVFTYKGLMYTGLPNLAHSFGYTNASWTLKSELISEFVCRLLNHMAAQGYTKVVAAPPATDIAGSLPAVDFTPGYIQRAIGEIPRRGTARPWIPHNNYVKDLMDIRYARLDDGVLHFSRAGQGATVAEQA